jgi:ribonuclease inhibitor
MIILLDGSKMKTREKAHEYIKQKLNFPDYYGMNLDALWDMLTTIVVDDLILYNKKAMLDNLGEHGEILIETFKEAAEENRNMKFRILNV